MSVQSSKTFLKVFGIIDIILGALQVILGVVATAGGGLLASGQIPVEEVETEMPAAIIVVAGVVLLLLGIFHHQPCACRNQPDQRDYFFRISGLPVHERAHQRHTCDGSQHPEKRRGTRLKLCRYKSPTGRTKQILSQWTGMTDA